MSSTIENISSNIKEAIEPFSSTKMVEGTQDFLQSNGLVAKFAFIIFVLILFFALLRFGINILTWLFSFSSSPILIDGMISGSGKGNMTISQDPNKEGAIPIFRSDNQDEGLEFTWSVWISVSSLEINENKYKPIFNKGSIDGKTVDNMYSNECPGLYIDKNSNKLIVSISTFNKPNELITIDNLPMNKWVNVILRLSQQTRLDVYINGVLAKRHNLSGIPKQNYDDIHVCSNGGFDGFLSDLRYFDKALGTSKIQSIVDKGPNMKMLERLDMKKTVPQYLSERWYTYYTPLA